MGAATFSHLSILSKDILPTITFSTTVFAHAEKQE
jgi:hypothetical protein